MSAWFAYLILLLIDQQYGGGHTQCARQSLKVIQADIPFTAFNGAYIGAVQSALLGKLFLAPPVQAAEITHITRQDAAGILFHGDVLAKHSEWVLTLRLAVVGRW